MRVRMLMENAATKGRRRVRTEALFLFLAIAEDGSIARAAKRMHITQQGASSMMKGLERELGTNLFKRSSNAIGLTKAGRALVKEARIITDAYDRMLATAAACKSPISLSRRVKIVATPWVLFYFMPFFESFQNATGGGCSFVFEEASVQAIKEMSSNLEQDVLYIVNIPSFMMAEYECLVSRCDILFEADLMVCGPSNSLLLGKSHVEPSDLDGLNFAYFNGNLIDDIARHVFKDAPNANVIIKTSNVDLIKAFSKEDGGLFGFTDSFSLFFHGLVFGECAVPMKDMGFITGAIGGGTLARDFLDYIKKFLSVRGYPTCW